MTNYIRKMLNDAQVAGLHIAIYGGEEEPDYNGYHPAEAEDAINAVEEAEVFLHKPNTDEKVGWAFIVNGIAEDERIADCGADDWVAAWTAANIPV